MIFLFFHESKSCPIEFAVSLALPLPSKYDEIIEQLSEDTDYQILKRLVPPPSPSRGFIKIKR